MFCFFSPVVDAAKCIYHASNEGNIINAKYTTINIIYISNMHNLIL
jgi:hypothetical protein